MQKNTSAAGSWDDYWRGTLDAAGPVEGGVRHPVIRKFWTEKLSASLGAESDAEIVDIASGDGAILDILSSLDPSSIGRVTCVDISPAAIDSIGSRFPEATGIVADAGSIPLTAQSFDLVTSQFGVEYAGPGAIDEAARLSAAGGSMILLLHMESSLMHRECRAALDAIRKTEDSSFVPLAVQMFEAGFAAIQGADRQAYDAAASRLNSAVRDVEAILAEFGEHVAADTIATLYSGVANIHSEIQHYEPAPVLNWLRVMRRELTSFARRMQSMQDVTLGEPDYARICERLRKQGFSIEPQSRLTDGDGTPLGWIVCARAAS